MKKYFLSVLSAISCCCSYSQDIHFSQFYETSILRNPAMAGIFTGDYKVGVLYRNQWSSISAPFQTGLLTAETRIPVSRDFLSVGMIAYYDRAGSVSLQTMSICPAINYNKLVNEEYAAFLSAGFMGGYVQRSFDPSKMTFDEQYQGNVYTPSNPTGEQFPDSKITQWDLGAGVSFTSSAGENKNITYVLGAAGYHLTKPKATFFASNPALDQQMKWSFNGGIGVKLNDLWRVQGHANYTIQGTYSEIILGGLLSWNKMDEREEHTLFSLHGGVFYRHEDAVIPTIKLDIRDFAVGVSYDFNVSSLKAASNLRGGYEVSVFKTGLLNNPGHEKSRTLCPKFH